jgi:hypothetical protein
MLIVRISGGIGNQLFQYATALQLAQRNSFPLLLDISSYSSVGIRSFYLDQIFPNVSIISKPYLKTLVEPQNIFLRIISKFLNLSRIPKRVETKKGFDLSIANIKSSCYLKGSFISYKYFESINSQLLNQFLFKNEIISVVNGLMSEYSNLNIVSVGVRRGDFLSFPSLNVCSKSYFEKSITKAREILKNPIFLFFSDDLVWVRKNFNALDFLFLDIPDRDPMFNLYAMSQCQHHIISNSSFHWWGAWLNLNVDKIVFCPSKVENDGCFPVDDYYPESWIRIDP